MRPNNVDISRDTVPIVLSQVIEVSAHVFIKDLADSNGETISNPGIEAPIIKHLIRNIERKLHFGRTCRVFDLQLVAIASRVSTGMTQATLKQIAIT